MFKASTYFIKEQIPGATISDLINLYKRALKEQSVSNISSNADTIDFTNDTFRFVLNKFSNKFSGFSQGQITIVDEEDEFGVYLRATSTRLFKSAGIIAAVIILFSLLNSEFTIFPFIIGLVVFILLVITGLVYTSIFFPVYFNSLRNDIERELEGQ
ncbi:hypothetical protein [Ferruginibacter albus]|uniref:hypothetical protein n=1 Tax=Ferruginibacter albus TaxID=2875540 RepID=UPI001CC4809D|nr:hypothetical protein [Ferruginibacter albus]UAY53369.1 hypothetical protein K9M53_06775 [Ferruginibacter albus]